MVPSNAGEPSQGFGKKREGRPFAVRSVEKNFHLYGLGPAKCPDHSSAAGICRRGLNQYRSYGPIVNCLGLYCSQTSWGLIASLEASREVEALDDDNTTSEAPGPHCPGAGELCADSCQALVATRRTHHPQSGCTLGGLSTIIKIMAPYSKHSHCML